MCLTFVSHFISKYFQTAIYLIPLTIESDLWSIALRVLEFVHQKIIYKSDQSETGCVTERLRFLVYSWGIITWRESRN